MNSRATTSSDRSYTGLRALRSAELGARDSRSGNNVGARNQAAVPKTRTKKTTAISPDKYPVHQATRGTQDGCSDFTIRPRPQQCSSPRQHRSRLSATHINMNLQDHTITPPTMSPCVISQHTRRPLPTVYPTEAADTTRSSQIRSIVSAYNTSNQQQTHSPHTRKKKVITRQRKTNKTTKRKHPVRKHTNIKRTTATTIPCTQHESINRKPTQRTDPNTTRILPQSSSVRSTTRKIPQFNSEGSITHILLHTSTKGKPTRKLPQCTSEESTTRKLPNSSSKGSTTRKLPHSSSEEKHTRKLPCSSSEGSTTRKLPQSTSEGKTTNKLPQSASEGNTTRKLPHSSSEGSTTHKLPQSTSEGKTTRKLPHSSSEGSTTRKLPHSSSEGSTTRKLPQSTSEGSTTRKLPQSTSEGKTTRKFPQSASEGSTTRILPQSSTEGKTTRKLPQSSTEGKTTGILPQSSTEGKTTGILPQSSTEGSTTRILPQSSTEGNTYSTKPPPFSKGPVRRAGSYSQSILSGTMKTVSPKELKFGSIFPEKHLGPHVYMTKAQKLRAEAVAHVLSTDTIRRGIGQKTLPKTLKLIDDDESEQQPKPPRDQVNKAPQNLSGDNTVEKKGNLGLKKSVSFSKGTKTSDGGKPLRRFDDIAEHQAASCARLSMPKVRSTVYRKKQIYKPMQILLHRTKSRRRKVNIPAPPPPRIPEVNQCFPGPTVARFKVTLKSILKKVSQFDAKEIQKLDDTKEPPRLLEGQIGAIPRKTSLSVISESNDAHAVETREVITPVVEKDLSGPTPDSDRTQSNSIHDADIYCIEKPETQQTSLSTSDMWSKSTVYIPTDSDIDLSSDVLSQHQHLPQPIVQGPQMEQPPHNKELVTNDPGIVQSCTTDVEVVRSGSSASASRLVASVCSIYYPSIERSTMSKSTKPNLGPIPESVWVASTSVVDVRDSRKSCQQSVKHTSSAGQARASNLIEVMAQTPTQYQPGVDMFEPKPPPLPATGARPHFARNITRPSSGTSSDTAVVDSTFLTQSAPVSTTSATQVRRHRSHEELNHSLRNSVVETVLAAKWESEERPDPTPPLTVRSATPMTDWLKGRIKTRQYSSDTTVDSSSDAHRRPKSANASASQGQQRSSYSRHNRGEKTKSSSTKHPNTPKTSKRQAWTSVEEQTEPDTRPDASDTRQRSNHSDTAQSSSNRSKIEGTSKTNSSNNSKPEDGAEESDDNITDPKLLPILEYYRTLTADRTPSIYTYSSTTSNYSPRSSVTSESESD